MIGSLANGINRTNTNRLVELYTTILNVSLRLRRAHTLFSLLGVYSTGFALFITSRISMYTFKLSGQNPLIWPLHIPIIQVTDTEDTDTKSI